MESPRDADGEVQDGEAVGRSARAGPTAQDVENARARQAIAEKQEREYAECLGLALKELGPGWTPWMKLTLVESDHHRHRDRPPVTGPTVYKVHHGEERLAENSRYLIRDADGRVRHAARYEDLFGELLHEKHPSYGFVRDGEWVASDRWTVCWSALELYRPKTANQLAALRDSRERRKEEQADAAWREANPLLAWAGIGRGDVEKEGA